MDILNITNTCKTRKNIFDITNICTKITSRNLIVYKVNKSFRIFNTCNFICLNSRRLDCIIYKIYKCISISTCNKFSRYFFTSITPLTISIKFSPFGPTICSTVILSILIWLLIKSIKSPLLP